MIQQSLVDGVAIGYTKCFTIDIAFGILSATVWVGLELDFLVAEHVVVVFRARQHPFTVGVEELEVLEQPECSSQDVNVRVGKSIRHLFDGIIQMDEIQVVLKSSSVTTADASDIHHKLQDSTLSTQT
ncbi:hypothetical protein Tco_0824027 [Tanacetum coccineum]|uniref:Uncharacterized protein n=1 Tax=Tanacetum coccineum TaxID=301880 RepID=A0ABQ5AKJ6_9ASTR